MHKILIANRGEIARRIIRTCQRLGIQTVAVYSEADKTSPHVREADEAVLIGEAPAQKSYMNIGAIIAAAKETGAEGIHPGYGFMSEHAEFAKAVAEAGLKFIGPDVKAITLMGDKISARKQMIASGVPVVPGTEAAVESEDTAAAWAEENGYPVMLKASAGGGGIGMQKVSSDAELRRAFASLKKRAQTYFGRGEMFVEKYIESPRHIEVQVLFDEHGQGVALWERECSIQRRHQKVLEEAPSSFVDEEMREKMLSSALKAAQSIGYTNAGTVEFVVSPDKQFYFLEMNTRLQVEHAITEEIFGTDLVEWQLRIASGESLELQQEDLSPQGHAIEVRVYAEDPVRMLPSPGTVTEIYLPKNPNVRYEMAFEEPSTVTPFYDPMIGKVIVYGNTREEAIDLLKKTLGEMRIEGIRTNIPLLQLIVADDRLRAGDTTTNFLADVDLTSLSVKN